MKQLLLFFLSFIHLSLSLSPSLSLSLTPHLSINCLLCNRVRQNKKENISKIEKSVELKKVSSAVPTVSYQTKA